MTHKSPTRLGNRGTRGSEPIQPTCCVHKPSHCMLSMKLRRAACATTLHAMFIFQRSHVFSRACVRLCETFTPTGSSAWHRSSPQPLQQPPQEPLNRHVTHMGVFTCIVPVRMLDAEEAGHSPGEVPATAASCCNSRDERTWWCQHPETSIKRHHAPI